MLANDIATLKAYILTQSDLIPLTSGPTTDRALLADKLNANANPNVLAWRTSVAQEEMDEAADYTVFDSISAGKRDSWGFMIAFPRNFTRTKVRKWVTDVWGNATANSAAESILQAATEKASRAENALGGGSVTVGTVTAIKRNWEGDVTIQDIAEMFNA